MLANFSCNNDDVKTLSIEMIENILDEKRRERKIKMVLNDEDIEAYIKIDMHEAIKTYNENVEDLEPHVKDIVEAKNKFMDDLCQELSLLRLGYMLTVLKKIHPQKASMLSAESFKSKVMILQHKEMRKAQFAKKGQESTQMSSGSMMLDAQTGKVM